MEHQAEKWQDFIRRRIVPAQLTMLSQDLADNSRLLNSAIEIRDEFYHGVMQEAAALVNEEQLRVLIYGYQTQLCFLMNQVFGYQMQLSDEPEAVRLYDQVLSDLEENLIFLQHYFLRYFDSNTPVPKCMLRKFHNKVTQWGAESVELKGDTDPALTREFLNSMKTLSGTQLSFSRLSYFNDLMEGLVSPITLTLPIPYGSQLMQWCILWNFNAPRVIDCIVGRISAVLQQLETEEEISEWLTRYQKYLYQLPADGEVGVFSNRLSVKEHLISWVQLEMNARPGVQKKKTEAISADPTSKINTSVSVPVLALLTRVLKEAGVITNTNLQELFRSISANYTSQRTESISPANFHGKYYTVEETTKRKVTDLLLEMVKVVRKIP